MKIIEVNLSDKITEPKGLKPVVMKKVGSIVLLAGKNGSGKTRILNLIREQAANLHNFLANQKNISREIEGYKHSIKNQPSQKIQYEKQIQQLEQNIKNLKYNIQQQPDQKEQYENRIPQYEQNIKNLKNNIEQQPAQKEQYENQIQQNEQNIENLKNNIEQQPAQKEQIEEQILEKENLLKNPIPIITDKEQQNIAVIDFVPNKIELEDWSNHAKSSWVQRASQAKSSGIASLHQSTIPLIQQVLERWVNTTHQDLEYSESDKQQSYADYERLQSIVKSFLGAEIGWDKDGYSTIFGRPIFQAELSAGQRILLQLCVAIFAQGGNLSNNVIFMDEPENHLHPSAVIDLLDAIKQHNPSGQIWIATHSIPLLSHFDASSLWFVEDGSVRHSGRKPENVLKSLLGDEDRIQKLRDFTSLPSELARNRFAFECLCPPAVVETDSSDDQSIQLNEQLKVIWKNKGTSINLLDFGAGKGRMICNPPIYNRS